MTYEVVVNNSGVIEPQPINPSEKFLNSENLPISDKTIGDYWQWAFSDLIGNTERGVKIFWSRGNLLISKVLNFHCE